MSIMKRHSVEEHANALAQYMPSGRTFEAAFIPNSNFRQILIGLAGQFRAGELSLKDFADFFIPDNANMLIPEWERALGIPDDCFNAQGTLGERQRDILVKLASLGAQTLDDFVNIAEKFNVNIAIYPGRDVFDTPSLAPGVTFKNIKESRFTLVIVYEADVSAVLPLTLPFTIGSTIVPILTCLYNKIKQANCKVIFDPIIP